MKQRFQQNRPTLKIGALDNSELSESEIKSPNLVIQPMAKFSGTKEDHYDAQTPLSYFQESHHKRNDKSMMSNLQGETQHSMRESAQFNTYKLSMEDTINSKHKNILVEQDELIGAIVPETLNEMEQT